MNKIYTGIGSRKTPPDILELMTRIATKLNQKGWTLRSGGAEGADKAFEAGAGTQKIIYLADAATPEAIEIAAQHHPHWRYCKPYAKKLHGRNAFQVLGLDLKSPTNFVICWTPDGCFSDITRSHQTGGTGTAISIATTHKIPVFNLKEPIFRKHFENWLEDKVAIKLLNEGNKIWGVQPQLISAKSGPNAGRRIGF